MVSPQCGAYKVVQPGGLFTQPVKAEWPAKLAALATATSARAAAMRIANIRAHLTSQQNEICFFPISTYRNENWEKLLATDKCVQPSRQLLLLNGADVVVWLRFNPKNRQAPGCAVGELDINRRTQPRGSSACLASGVGPSRPQP